MTAKIKNIELAPGWSKRIAENEAHRLTAEAHRSAAECRRKITHSAGSGSLQLVGADSTGPVYASERNVSARVRARGRTQAGWVLGARVEPSASGFSFGSRSSAGLIDGVFVALSVCAAAALWWSGL